MNIKKRAIIIFYCAIISISSGTQAGEIRTWVSKSGDTVEAELIKTTTYHILLQNVSGKQMKIRKTQLSQQDLRYLDKLDALKEFDTALKESAFELRGKIEKIIGDDIIIFNPKRVKVSIIPDPKDKVKRMNPKMVEHEELIPIIQQYKTVMVLNARKDTDFDGGKWAGIVYPYGVKSVKRRNKILKCFTTNFKQSKQKTLAKLTEENDDTIATIDADAIRKLTASMKTIKKDPSIPKRIRMK